MSTIKIKAFEVEKLKLANTRQITVDIDTNLAANEVILKLSLIHI